MNQSLVRVGLHVVNLSAVASAHWEREMLYVHLAGGRFLSFRGEDARLIWDAILRLVGVDLRTGEVAAS